MDLFFLLLLLFVFFSFFFFFLFLFFCFVLWFINTTSPTTLSLQNLRLQKIQMNNYNTKIEITTLIRNITRLAWLNAYIS